MPEPASATDPRPSHTQARLRTFGLVVLVVLAAVHFCVRGPWRAPGMSHDFAVIYASARAMWAGQSPYDPDDMQAALVDGNYEGGVADEPRSLIGLYPAGAYVLLGPVVQPAWPAAKWLWLVINLVAVGLLVWRVWLLGCKDRFDKTTGVLLAMLIVLAAAPLHTGIMVGQLALVVTLLIVWSFDWSLRDRAWGAGVLAGLALTLKPQLGVIMLAFFICRLKWKGAVASVLVAAALTGIGVGWMQFHEVDWLADMRASFARFGEGGPGDMSNSGMAPFQFVTLNYLLHQFTDNRALVGAVAVGFGALTTLAAVVLIGKRKGATVDLLLVSILGAACLLSSAHRFYDALVLVLAATWVCGCLGQRESARWPAWAALVMLAAFLVPGGAILGVAVKGGHIPESISSAMWWRVLAQPHEVWALLGLVAMMLVAIRRTGRSQSPPTPSPRGRGPG